MRHALTDKLFQISAALAVKTETDARESRLPHHSVEKENIGIHGSSMRNKYRIRLVQRVLLFLALTLVYIYVPAMFDAAEGMRFFESPSWLHLLWLYWMIETILPSFATKGMISMGAIKFAGRVYIPGGKFQPKKLIAYMKQSTKDSLKVFVVWVFWMLGLTVGYLFDILGTGEMILICAFLNVLDVIFVLYWCPFRKFLLKNRCCTTCRIFNWDHILIYSALFFVPGFFGYTLLAMSILEFAVWEVCFFLHPERFWEGSNLSLRCSNCTDKICVHSKLYRDLNREIHDRMPHFFDKI